MEDHISNQHVWTHYVYDGPRVNVKVERNSRGINWEVTVVGCANPDEALKIIRETDAKMAAQFAPPPVVETPEPAKVKAPEKDKPPPAHPAPSD